MDFAYISAVPSGLDLSQASHLALKRQAILNQSLSDPAVQAFSLRVLDFLAGISYWL